MIGLIFVVASDGVIVPLPWWRAYESATGERAVYRIRVTRVTPKWNRMGHD